MSHANVQAREAAESKLATAGTVALWTVQIAVAAFFAMGGITKLAGSPEMVGAVLTHLFLIEGSASMALLLCVVTSLIAFAWRQEIFRLVHRAGSMGGPAT